MADHHIFQHVKELFGRFLTKARLTLLSDPSAEVHGVGNWASILMLIFFFLSSTYILWFFIDIHALTPRRSSHYSACVDTYTPSCHSTNHQNVGPNAVNLSDYSTAQTKTHPLELYISTFVFCASAACLWSNRR